MPWIKPFVKEFFVFYSWILDWLPRSSWLSFQAFKVVELDKEVFKFGADLHVLDVFPSQSFGQNRLPFSINCVNCFFSLLFNSSTTFCVPFNLSPCYTYEWEIFPPWVFWIFFCCTTFNYVSKKCQNKASCLGCFKQKLLS